MSADSFEEETKYAEIYMEFSDLIGESNMRKVYNRYRGLKVDFPKRIYSKEYVVQMLRKFEGKRQCLNWLKSMITASGTYGN